MTAAAGDCVVVLGSSVGCCCCCCNEADGDGSATSGLLCAAGPATVAVRGATWAVAVVTAGSFAGVVVGMLSLVTIVVVGVLTESTALVEVAVAGLVLLPPFPVSPPLPPLTFESHPGVFGNILHMASVTQESLFAMIHRLSIA